MVQRELVDIAFPAYRRCNLSGWIAETYKDCDMASIEIMGLGAHAEVLIASKVYLYGWCGHAVYLGVPIPETLRIEVSAGGSTGP